MRQLRERPRELWPDLDIAAERIFEIDPHGDRSAQPAGLLSRLAALFRR